VKRRIILRQTTTILLIIFCYSAGAEETSAKKFPNNSHPLAPTNRNCFSQEDIKLGVESLASGSKDAFAGTSKMSEQEICDTMAEFQKTTQKILTEKRRATAKTEKGKKLLAVNLKKEGEKTTASELQDEIFEPDRRRNLTSTDVLSVQYSGTLTDGTDFDSSNPRGEPATFPQNDSAAGMSFDEWLHIAIIPPSDSENPSAEYYALLLIHLKSLLKADNKEHLEINYDFSIDDAVFITLLNHLSIHDDIPAALRILYDLWRSDSESVRNYPNLAVAFALVWDQPPGTNWVRHALPPGILKPGTETIPERFAFYVRSAKEKRLENNLTKLSARELMFVVDTPLPLPELEWAQKTSANLALSSTLFIFQSLTTNNASTTTSNPKTTMMLTLSLIHI